MLTNQNRTVNYIFLDKPTDKHNEEIYLQTKILFSLRENFFKKLFNKKIIRSDSDQLDIEEYEESITERTKLRRETSAELPNEQPDNTDMPELENEESAEQRRNQQGKGLKILTPNQMLSRLPISLAQLKAGNNLEKLKNETRQLLYSLYR